MTMFASTKNFTCGASSSAVRRDRFPLLLDGTIDLLGRQIAAPAHSGDRLNGRQALDPAHGPEPCVDGLTHQTGDRARLALRLVLQPSPLLRSEQNLHP